MKSFSSVVWLFSFGACYVYVPVESAAPEPGSEIRAHLSPTQDFDVGTVTVRDVARVDGIVYGVAGDSVAVWSSWLYSTYGTRFDSRRAVYYLPREQMATLEQRRLHPLRSAVAVGIGVGIMTSLLNFATDGGAGRGTGGGPGPIEARSAGPLR